MSNSNLSKKLYYGTVLYWLPTHTKCLHTSRLFAELMDRFLAVATLQVFFVDTQECSPTNESIHYQHIHILCTSTMNYYVMY